MYKTILIVDDEPDICELLSISLESPKIHTKTAETLNAAKNILTKQAFDLCLTDMRLPDGTGLKLIEHVQKYYPHMPIIMITAFGCVETAIDALKAGAYDFLTKPVDLNHLKNLTDTLLQEKTINNKYAIGNNFLGKSPQIQDLQRKITKLAQSAAPVYINGESGTGKELVAKMIHEQSLRANNPFIAVNCGAIPSELMESEFFGHKKGSFTGAINDKEGLFQSAQGGTLFLDEVADLPLSMQVKLLRVIQEKAVRPVGASKELPIDVRILSATHKNLAQMVADGDFRQDLYYRLNVIELKIPPLRERSGDIELLTASILQRLSSQENKPFTLDNLAQNKLKSYDFPGNVRELENILERACILCNNNIISANDLLFNETNISNNAPANNMQESQHHQTTSPDNDYELDDIHNLDQYLANIERTIILKTLEKTKWNRTAAAQLLGINFRSMRHRLKKLEID